MKISYTQHLLSRLKLRKIPKSLTRNVYLKKETELYDNLEHHYIRLRRDTLFGKMRLLVVVFDKLENKVELITFYPTDKTEIDNKIKTGRWSYEKS